MPPRTVRVGRVTAEIRGLDAALEAAIERGMPGVLRRMEQEVGEAMAAIMEVWPEKTGRSLRGFYRETEIRKNGRELSVAVKNRQRYWIYVKWSRFTRQEQERVKLLAQGPLAWLAVKTLRQVRADYPQHVDDKRIQNYLSAHNYTVQAAPRDQWAGQGVVTKLRQDVRRRSQRIAQDLADVLARSI